MTANPLHRVVDLPIFSRFFLFLTNRRSGKDSQACITVCALIPLFFFPVGGMPTCALEKQV